MKALNIVNNKMDDMLRCTIIQRMESGTGIEHGTLAWVADTIHILMNIQELVINI